CHWNKTLPPSNMSTVILAQIMGPVLVAVGIGFLLHPKFYAKMIKDFEEHEGLTFFTGMFTMILGLIVVVNHNIWEVSVAGLITLFGWSSLVKGTIFLIAPNLLFSTAHMFYKNKTVMNVAMVFCLIMGAFLCKSYFGYFA
ncbi:MAG: hypothetical protein ABIE14_05500, partial [Patescibacteria group bacterium]